ncbi:putative histone-lysine N-methyltransferase [Helianthus annuus]|nr:putative histone-lysine N-methyltransferase [Helianthus annuus]
MEEELYLLGSSLEDSSVKDEQLTFLNTNAASSVESEAAVGNAVYLLPSFYNRNCGLFCWAEIKDMYNWADSLYLADGLMDLGQQVVSHIKGH